MAVVIVVIMIFVVLSFAVACVSGVCAKAACVSGPFKFQMFALSTGWSTAISSRLCPRTNYMKQREIYGTASHSGAFCGDLWCCMV